MGKLFKHLDPSFITGRAICHGLPGSHWGFNAKPLLAGPAPGLEE